MSFLWEVERKDGLLSLVITDDDEIVTEAAKSLSPFVGSPIDDIRNWENTDRLIAMGPIKARTAKHITGAGLLEGEEE